MTFKSVKYSVPDNYEFREFVELMQEREGIEWDEDDPRWDHLYGLFYETLFDIEVCLETGESVITHVNGVALHVE